MAALGAAAAEPPAPWQALAGVWTLNRSLSEAPQAPSDEGGGQRGPRGGGGSFGGYGGAMGGPGGGMGGPPAGMRGAERGMGDQAGGRLEREARDGEHGRGDRPGFVGGAAALKLDVQDAEVRIITEDGHVRILTPDGQPVKRERGFLTVDETAKWENGRLTVTSSAPNGTLVTETLGLAEDKSGRLVHEVQVTRIDSGTPRTARWVYDRSADGAKAGKSMR